MRNRPHHLVRSRQGHNYSHHRVLGWDQTSLVVWLCHSKGRLGRVVVRPISNSPRNRRGFRKTAWPTAGEVIHPWLWMVAFGHSRLSWFHQVAEPLLGPCCPWHCSCCLEPRADNLRYHHCRCAARHIPSRCLQRMACWGEAG